MHKFIFLSWIVGCMAISGPVAAQSSFGQKAIQEIDAKLRSCGLNIIPAAGYPLPVYADEVIVNRLGNVLAVRSTVPYFNGFSVTYSNPNGGEAHVIGMGTWQTTFSTPRAGIVAMASRYSRMPGNFNGIRYQCLGRATVSDFHFEACITRYFVYPIVAQLCR